MVRRPFRIATTEQLEKSVQEAGFDAYRLPEIASEDFHRSIKQRLEDGPIYRAFLEQHDIDLLLDFNTAALTLITPDAEPEKVMLTNAAMGVPYVACYLDPITSTMNQAGWADHWQLLESEGWIKWVWETAHAEELLKLGVPNVLSLPMAAADLAYDEGPLPEQTAPPAVAFMGHPATGWFGSEGAPTPRSLFAGMTAAAVQSDMPDVSFHKIFYDLYEFAAPPEPTDDLLVRAQKSLDYYGQKFAFNAFLAVKQRDRFAHFLKRKLGDNFELIGDHWGEYYGLDHTARIWDKAALHARIRGTPICLNLMKGGLETGMNVRHFEIPSVGGFMLTYETAELGTCFAVGEECDVFRCEADLLDKIQFYLQNPVRRREIAKAGQERTLREHLYSHRIGRLVEILCETGVLPKKASAVKSAAVERLSPAIGLDPVVAESQRETSL